MTLKQTLRDIVPTVFQTEQEILNAGVIIQRLLCDHPEFAFAENSLKATLSVLGQDADSPIRSCRPHGNGYKLRTPDDPQVVPQQIPSARSRGNKRPTFDLKSKFDRLEDGATGIPLHPQIENLLMGKDRDGVPYITLRPDTEEDSELEIPIRSYLVSSRGPNSEYVVKEGERDPTFTVVFGFVLGGLFRDDGCKTISVLEFVEAVESELAYREKGSAKTCLGAKEQQGLVGELWFLSRMIANPKIGGKQAVEAWHGNAGSPIDFWFKGGCVEIKTSRHSAKEIQISSILQLDHPGVQHLFLAHIRVDTHDGGEAAMTLPGYVAAVREQLQEEPAAIRDEFERRLMKSQTIGAPGGKQYRDTDSRHYKTLFYVAKNAGPYFHCVPTGESVGSGGFPRFTNDQIDAWGVKLAKYSIRIDRLGDFTDESEVLGVLSPSGSAV